MPICPAGLQGYVKKGQVCYKCGQEILKNQPHIYYAGYRSDGKEGHIFLHMECTATLAMCLIADVMSEESETSVKNTLQNIRNVFQLQREQE